MDVNKILDGLDCCTIGDILYNSLIDCGYPPEFSELISESIADDVTKCIEGLIEDLTHAE